MSSDIGCALRTEPSTISDRGSVDQHGFDASDCPASPPTMKIIDICAPSTACAATSTATLRRARRTSDRELGRGEVVSVIANP